MLSFSLSTPENYIAPLAVLGIELTLTLPEGVTQHLSVEIETTASDEIELEPALEMIKVGSNINATSNELM